MSERLLSLFDVSIAFGGIQALDSVTLEVPAGVIFALIGPNGAGKSTLFNCVAGLAPPDRGSIVFDRCSLRGLRPDRIAALGLARTFQNIELFSKMTVAENVLLGRHLRMTTGPISGMIFGRRTRDEEASHRHRVDQILELLKLRDARDTPIANLPYGARKKVELARALALEPKLILLDEPSAGMNEQEKDEIARVLCELKERVGITVLLVEHDIAMVMEISDRVAVLDQGRKIAEGTPNEITADRRVIEAYVGRPHEHADPDESRTSPPMP